MKVVTIQEETSVLSNLDWTLLEVARLLLESALRIIEEKQVTREDEPKQEAVEKTEKVV